MKLPIMAVAGVALLALTGCSESAADEAPAETLDAYKAVGTEPFWTVEVAGETIKFEAMDGPQFELALSRVNRTDSGWELKAFSDSENINMTIALDQECSDGMSDRVYADTVAISVGAFGSQTGCGGEFTGGEGELTADEAAGAS